MNKRTLEITLNATKKLTVVKKDKHIPREKTWEELHHERQVSVLLLLGKDLKAYPPTVDLRVSLK